VGRVGELGELRGGEMERRDLEGDREREKLSDVMDVL
jgi:hypothetical protein